MTSPIGHKTQNYYVLVTTVEEFLGLLTILGVHSSSKDNILATAHSWVQDGTVAILSIRHSGRLPSFYGVHTYSTFNPELPVIDVREYTLSRRFDNAYLKNLGVLGGGDV